MRRAVVAAALVLAGCAQVVPVNTPTAVPTATATPVPTAATPANVLDSLRVIPRPRSVDYQREAFGPAWEDVDNNGCNTRDDILARDVDKTQKYAMRKQGSCDHDMISGTWHDPYTGETLTFTDLKDVAQAQAIQIEHIVALSVAWRYGANEWDYEKRVQFANDPDNLQAAGAQANTEKAGADAAAWRPKKPYQCDFATRYVAVKAKWDLAVDNSEKAALAEMLETC
ncbi:MAG: HNH endonuclease family protein [Propionibacteriaceae bacterium]|jgi:hypothetical protein|nr:HNH endonuclease family protein [Propionibacteriaceae bacterium]